MTGMGKIPSSFCIEALGKKTFRRLDVLLTEELSNCDIHTLLKSVPFIDSRKFWKICPKKIFTLDGALVFGLSDPIFLPSG